MIARRMACGTSMERALPLAPQTFNIAPRGLRSVHGVMFILGSAILLALGAAAAQGRTPRSAKEYLDRGVARYSAGDLEGAIADFDRAIAINSGFSGRARGGGAITQNLVGSESRQDSVVVIDRFNAVAYYNRGTAWYAKGGVELAIADFDKAISIDTGYTDAYIRRGRAWQARGNLNRALADYDRAIRIDPTSAFAYNNRGIAREDKGDISGAIADFDMAILLDNRLAEAYINRSTARCATGDVAGAIADLDVAIGIDPRNAVAYNNRASARRAAGDLAEAMADHDRAIKLDPRNASAYVNRGVTLVRQRKRQEAEADFQRASSLGEMTSRPNRAQKIRRYCAPVRYEIFRLIFSIASQA